MSRNRIRSIRKATAIVTAAVLVGTGGLGAAQAATSPGIAISYFPKMSVIAAGSSSCGLPQPASKNVSQFFAQGRP